MSQSPVASDADYYDHCQKCSEKISKGQSYCGRCGNEIDPNGVPSCPRCLTSVWKSDRFCRRCGIHMCTCPSSANHEVRS